MAIQFEYLNDQLSACPACGVATSNEDQHNDYHAAVAELAKSHNQNAKALQSMADQAHATAIAIVQLTELVFDMAKSVSELQGLSPAEIDEMAGEATRSLDALKARVNLPT
jgi:DNA-binding IclR family transcriptional regulator